MQFWMKRRDRQKQLIRKLPGGAKILCDMAVPYEAMVYLRQEEEAELQVLPRLLSPDHTFVDCGANVGLWSLVAASCVGEGIVHAFEPNPRTFQKLTRNINTLNEFPASVNLHEAAVGGAEGFANFLPLDSHNISSIVPEPSEASISVKITSLDQALNDCRVDAIKIDVEGYELEILRGAVNVLDRWKPWLCVEFNTEIAKVNFLRDWDVHDFLRERGFRPCLFQYGSHITRSSLPDNWEGKGYVNLFYFNDRDI